MDAAKTTGSKAIRVPVPESDYRALRDYSEEHGVLVSMVVADAVAKQTVEIWRRAVLADIADFQKRLGKKAPPTGVNDIREIRQARIEQLTPDKPGEESGK